MPNTKQKEYSKRAVYDYFTFLKGRKVLSMTVYILFESLAIFVWARAMIPVVRFFFFFNQVALKAQKKRASTLPEAKLQIISERR